MANDRAGLDTGLNAGTFNGMKKRSASKLDRMKRDGDKVRLEVRVDPELLQGLTALAAVADVSVTRLMAGMIRACIDNAHPGGFWEAGNKSKPGQFKVGTKETQRCVWFGAHNISEESGSELDPWFQLDFREARTIQMPIRPLLDGTEVDR